MYYKSSYNYSIKYSDQFPVPGLVERESTMLASAKENLRNMAFFGITAQQSKSQTLFEKTFGLKFQSNFEDLAEDQNSVSFMPDLSQAELERVKSLNRYGPVKTATFLLT